MNQKLMRFLFSGLIFIPWVADSRADNGMKPASGEYRVIKDLDDRMIQVPMNPKRIAMLHGPSYDRLLMLGRKDALALLPLRPSPWTLVFFPGIKNIPVITSYVTVDVEQMINTGVDLVFYSLHPEQAERLRQVGISTACPFSEKKRPENMNEFVENFKRQIMFFGEILGPAAGERARKYCDYFNSMVRGVISVTSGFKKNIRRPSVYYGGLENDLFYTQGRNTIMHWCVEAAGGRLVTEAFRTHYVKVSMEDIIAWDPDFILIGMRGSFNLLNNSALKNLRAVRNKNIYMVPVGSFWWDLAGGETVFLPLFLAKKFHPARFADRDLTAEMKKFYSEFYGYNISEKEIELILKALPPGAAD